MQITEINGFDARCSARGIEREVSLFLLQDDTLQVGDYVLIHVGYAIQRLSAEQAQETWDLFDEAFGAEAALSA